jgi:hypothetical protein
LVVVVVLGLSLGLVLARQALYSPETYF